VVSKTLYSKFFLLFYWIEYIGFISKSCIVLLKFGISALFIANRVKKNVTVRKFLKVEKQLLTRIVMYLVSVTYVTVTFFIVLFNAQCMIDK